MVARMMGVFQDTGTGTDGEDNDRKETHHERLDTGWTDVDEDSI